MTLRDRRLLPVLPTLAFAVSLTAPSTRAQELLGEWEGEVLGDRFGAAVASVEDLDGDGVPDVAISAPRHSADHRNSGSVWLYSGGDGTQLLHLSGRTQNEEFGSALAGLGDVSGDAVPDFAVGARSNGEGGVAAGKVYVLSGVDGAVLYEVLGEREWDLLGSALAAVDDVDGDGVADLLAGAPRRDQAKKPGRADLLSGASGQRIERFESAANYTHLGASLASAPDLDGDGVGELLVGAPGRGPVDARLNGEAFVYSGATRDLLFHFTGEGESNLLGFALAAAGDQNDDGIAEILITAPGYDVGHGRVYVYSGLDGSLVQTIDNEERSGHYGQTLANVGDFNGDGWTDFAFRHLPGPTMDGAVLLHSGRHGRLLKRFESPEEDDGFGLALAPAGDLNGDFLSDFLVGAHGDENPLVGPVHGGRATAFGGNDLLLVPEGDAAIAGEPFEMAARGGEPRTDAALALVAFDGAPIFRLISQRRLNEFGEWDITHQYPKFLRGSTLTLQAFALKPNGRVAKSLTIDVRIR